MPVQKKWCSINKPLVQRIIPKMRGKKTAVILTQAKQMGTRKIVRTIAIIVLADAALPLPHRV